MFSRTASLRASSLLKSLPSMAGCSTRWVRPSSVATRSLSSAADAISPNTQEYIDREHKYGCMNYLPMPVIIDRGEGVHVWDIDGKQYLDFLSAYSAVNQGHCHPRLVKVMTEQASKLTLTSRAFYNSVLGGYEQYITELFGFDRVLPMNSGVEACESAVKFARRWGYDTKGVARDKATVVFARNNFWGRSIAAISSSTDPDAYGGFGPYLPGSEIVPYDDVPAIERAFQANPNICAFMVEPIQGEAGVVVPSDGYLKEVRRLCDQYNVLFIADEVQTGIARTGRMLCVDHSDVKPDILILGKALSGGMLPVSAMLTSDEVMLNIRPGQHGSTYGGNPLACAVAQEALQIVQDEGLAERAEELGVVLRGGLVDLQKKHESLIKIVRGKGLLNAMVIDPTHTGVTAQDVCLAMMKRGLLAKPTHSHTIRLAPPLVITKDQVESAVGTVSDAIDDCLARV